jgi:hypothetical protein
MQSEHQRETAFLRQCILYEEGNEGRQLEQRIIRIQRDERSLRHATWLASLLMTLAGLVFGYMAFLMEDLPNHISLFAAEFIGKTLCALGIGSLISLLAFGWLGMRNRHELNLRREECRRLVTTLLERRLGKLPAAPPKNGELKRQEYNQVPKSAGSARNGEPEPAMCATVGIGSPDC